jgi:hypothetical protein
MNMKLTSVLAAVLLLSACSQNPGPAQQANATQGGATNEQPAAASAGGATGAAAPSAVSEELPPDQWSKGVWTVDDATGPGAPVLMSVGGKNGLRLVPKGDGGKVIYYQVEVVGEAMAEEWKGAILFPRGTEPVAAWPAENKLDPWKADMTTAETGNYNSNLAKGKKAIRINTSTQRLEGDVHVNGVAEALQLAIVPDANKDGSELLLVDLTDSRQPIGPVQNGSGHGGPRT